jgi:hypothetical protein
LVITGTSTQSQQARENGASIGAGTAALSDQPLIVIASAQRCRRGCAFWMYVTGHRLGDWRRMLRSPYNPAPYGFVTEDVYPVGGSLSTTLEFPTPQLTSPSPNYKACDPTIP